MINTIATILLCTFAAQSGDQTVLATAERLFYSGDFQQSADMIDSHSWIDSSLWSKAGLIRELCHGGWSFQCPAMPLGDFQPYNSLVSISLSGEFQIGDSVRVSVPIPAELPWQFPLDSPDITVTGISGSVEASQGWLILEGVSEGAFEVSISQSVSVIATGFPGVDAPGGPEAMVPFPGEYPFLDRCLDTDVFWTGGDAVYMESAILAAGEPNPIRLVSRVIDAVSVFYGNSDPMIEQVLLKPVSELAVRGEMFNSMGGSALGAAVLRRWQIPALVVPGSWSDSGARGFLLATFVKPFGWMVISPCPNGFTALGSFDPPHMRSWFNGIAGITFQAEYLGSNGFWYAVSVDSHEFSHSVEILIQ